MRHGRDAKRWTATALIVLAACATLPAAAQGAESWLPAGAALAGGTSNLKCQDRRRTRRASRPWSGASSRTAAEPRLRVACLDPRARRARGCRPSSCRARGEAFSGDCRRRPRRAGSPRSGTRRARSCRPSEAAGQAWTAAQAIPTGTAGNADLFVASDGTATAVWTTGTTVDLVIRTARRRSAAHGRKSRRSRRTWSYRPHIEGDTHGDVTVSSRTKLLPAAPRITSRASTRRTADRGARRPRSPDRRSPTPSPT